MQSRITTTNMIKCTKIIHCGKIKSTTFGGVNQSIMYERTISFKVEKKQQLVFQKAFI